jgi:outer membrane lipoprotein-sorting protein
MKAPRNRCPETGVRRIIPLLGLVAVLLFAGTRSLQAQDARAIVERMDKNMRGDYSTQELTMTIVRPTWQRTISMKGWSVGQDYSMILITAPAKEKGQVFLKREKEMWNWVPAIDRMIKIPPSMMMQSWMGSDFTNDDLVRESSVIDDYEHRLLGKEMEQGRSCFKIELIPKPETAVVWGKILLWITEEDYLQLKVEFYDEDEMLKNTQYLSNIQTMGKRKLPTHWEMVPAGQEGKKTVVDLVKTDFDTVIPESFFSQQNMKTLR